MRWIQWDDNERRWCKPHRIIGDLFDYRPRQWRNETLVIKAYRISCNSAVAAMEPTGRLDLYLPWDEGLRARRDRTPEEQQWKRVEKIKDGVTTITFSDPINRYSFVKQRIRLGEVAEPSPGLCKVCDWKEDEAVIAKRLKPLWYDK